MSRDAKRVFWEQHIQAWRNSALPQLAYCQGHALSVSSFRYWRKRCAAVPAAPCLTVVPVVRATNSVGAQLRSPGGWQISLPATLSAEALLSVLMALP